MKPEVLLEKLEIVAAQLDVKVSYESIGASVGSGGLCRVKSQYRVIIEKRTIAAERVDVLAAALARIDTTGISLEPAVRNAIGYYSQNNSQHSARQRATLPDDAAHDPPTLASNDISNDAQPSAWDRAS